MFQSTRRIDSTWVVPYNLGLLQKYQCHINVECVAFFDTPKYLFKYTYKGPDYATVEFENANEIKMFYNELNKTAGLTIKGEATTHI